MEDSEAIARLVLVNQSFPFLPLIRSRLKQEISLKREMVKILEKQLSEEAQLCKESEEEYLHAKNQLSQYYLILNQNQSLKKDCIQKEKGMVSLTFQWCISVFIF
jgi:hypothetical protein